MKKPYLLIAGDRYYPNGFTEDWVGCFETEEQAKALYSKLRKKANIGTIGHVAVTSFAPITTVKGFFRITQSG